MDDLDGVADLRRLFRAVRDKHAAQERARDVLLELASDPGSISWILSRHLGRRGALDKRHYPVLSMTIDSNPDFELVANCWLPLPNGLTNMSTKAIHHHGEMLLTTVTAFGPGYEHWLFSCPEVSDPERELFSARILDRTHHGLHDVVFVDAYTAHVPMFVPRLTITFALWSSRTSTSWKDYLKRSSIVSKHASGLRRVGTRLGLAKALDLKAPHYFDFYPSPEGLVGSCERREFDLGPNDDYLRSLFHVVQATGNERLIALLRAAGDRAVSCNRDLLSDLIGQLESGSTIHPCLSPGHYGVPTANFSSEEILRALDVN